MVAIVIFTMMAIGLNIVVGYAGPARSRLRRLLRDRRVHGGLVRLSALLLGRLRVRRDRPAGGRAGFHISIWLVLIIAGVITPSPACSSACRRFDFGGTISPSSRSVSGRSSTSSDERRRRRIRRFNKTNFNLTNGAFGINPVDPPGFGGWLRTSSGCPPTYVENGSYVNFVHLLDADRAPTGHGLLQPPAARLAPRPRLDRDPRGRGCRSRDGDPADADENVGLRERRVLRRRCRSLVRLFKQGVFPDDFLFNFSIFILCMVILGGMGNVWGAIAGAAFLTYLDKEGLSNLAGWFNERDFVLFQCDPGRPGPDEADQRRLPECAAAPDRHLRDDLGLSDAVPAARPDTRGAAEARDRGRRPREPLMDVRHSPE